jgi:hypothetical protein
MNYAIDKITGNVVTILRDAKTEGGRCVVVRCVVIRHTDGSEQIQFKSLLIGL